MDWKKLVRNIAPVLGTALGGPMSGAAVKFIGDKLLGNPGATEADVADFVLGASPEKLLELKTIDNDFELKMRELDVDVFRLETEATTAHHQADMSSDSWLSKNIRPMALAFLTVTTVILAYFSIFSELKDGQIRTLDMWLGVLLPLLLTAYGFYFGGRSLEKLKLSNKSGESTT